MEDSPARIIWIDTLKGLLIISVVIHHISWYVNDCCGLRNDAFVTIDNVPSYLWVSFFMPCFFTITGYCSNFTKEFGTFLKANIVSLLWPSLVLMLGRLHWFLAALFLSKLICWSVEKLKIHKGYSSILIVVFFILGFSMKDIAIGDIPVAQVFSLCPFMYLGIRLKNIGLSTTFEYAMALLYFGLVLYLCVNGFEIPFITGSYMVTEYSQIPLYLLLAVSGIFASFRIAKIIGPCKPLDYLGRTSLVILLVHLDVLNKLAYLIRGTICNNSDNMRLSIVVYCFLGVATVGVSSGVAYFLNLRYIRWLIGKDI